MKHRITLLIVFSVLFLSSRSQNYVDQNIKAKYIFLFIGDGMGIQQVNATQVYIDSVVRDNNNISFINFPVQTFCTTFAANQYITCSAAAGTAISSGSKTSIGTIGLNYNHTDTLFSFAKTLKAKGFKIGILSSVSIDHATPAAFYAHQGSRGSNYEIAKDIFKSNYDFFASGGFLDPEGKELKTPVESIYSLGKKFSTCFTTNLKSIDSLKAIYKTVVYSAPNSAQESTLKYEIDRKSNEVSLSDITKKAIETLYNPNGFFMMVEGGKIDWSCHSNDAATTILEVRAFSDAVARAVEFYNAHPDETLIIVTSDHETGGFSLGNKENKYGIKLSLLQHQKISEEELQILIKSELRKSPKPNLELLLNIIKENTGLGNTNIGLSLTDKELKQIKDSYDASIKPIIDSKTNKPNYLLEPKESFTTTCIDILNRKAAIGWTSGSHTGTPVPIYVLGKGQFLFTGKLDNTDISRLILKATNN
ncbi:MAG: alkaline phosphatase [Tenuifilaceae bacterium]